MSTTICKVFFFLWYFDSNSFPCQIVCSVQEKCMIRVVLMWFTNNCKIGQEKMSVFLSFFYTFHISLCNSFFVCLSSLFWSKLLLWLWITFFWVSCQHLFKILNNKILVKMTVLTTNCFLLTLFFLLTTLFFNYAYFSTMNDKDSMNWFLLQSLIYQIPIIILIFFISFFCCSIFLIIKCRLHNTFLSSFPPRGNPLLQFRRAPYAPSQSFPLLFSFFISPALFIAVSSYLLYAFLSWLLCHPGYHTV